MERKKPLSSLHHREYVVWAAMRNRCYNVNNGSYRHYGGRGITVCERWRKSFENFFADMGERPARLTIDTMIYQKTNFSHPEKNRYHSVFEYVFILSKGAPKTFNPIMDRENITAGEIGNLGVNTFTERDGSKSVRSKKMTKEFGMRHNVWIGLTRGQEEMCQELPHPAMMPKWLVRDLIISWSNKGDIVLDPMAGSGTTPQIAKRLGRKTIAIDISEKYVHELVEPLMTSIDPLFNVEE